MPLDKANNIYVSIVIPARNESENVRQCLKSILASNLNAEFEVIFADSSTDNTPDIVKSLGVRLLENVPGTISAVRNTGAHVTRGNILVFLDGDIQIPPDLLEKAKVWFDDGFKGALGFTERAPDNAGWVAKTWGNRIHQKLDKVVDTGYLPGRNFFINRSVFEELNGFDESLKTNEDKDFSLRIRKAGYRVISVPDTQLFHLGYEKTFTEFIQKEFWRQSSSVKAVQRSRDPIRAMRAPLFSFWHITLLLSLPISLFFGDRLTIVLLLSGWALPSAIISQVKLGSNLPYGFTLAFFFLTLVRWTVAGAALIKQLVIFLLPKNRRLPTKTN